MVTAKERTLELQGKNVKPAGVLRFRVNGHTFDVDPQTVTVREGYLARKEVTDAGFPESSTFISAGLAWVVARRTLPELTFDDVIDAITVADLNTVERTMEDDSPEV